MLFNAKKILGKKRIYIYKSDDFFGYKLGKFRYVAKMQHKLKKT